MSVLVNGRPSAGVDATDRGLQYGDGLFETLSVRDGRARLLDRHLARLAAGSARLGLPAPDAPTLEREIAAVAPAGRAVVKLIWTRGTGPRGYRPPDAPVPTRVLARHAWPAWPLSHWSDGVRVRSCRLRLGRNPALAGLKHLNRLEQVLARAEWADESVAEGLMMDDLGNVIGGTQTNLFASLDGRFVTPAVGQCGVAGVMRDAFRAWAAGQGAAVEERAITAVELASADGLWLTNALIGAWPVRELDGRPLAPDAWARRFNDWLARQ